MTCHCSRVMRASSAVDLVYMGPGQGGRLHTGASAGSGWRANGAPPGGPRPGAGGRRIQERLGPDLGRRNRCVQPLHLRPQLCFAGWRYFTIDALIGANSRGGESSQILANARHAAASLLGGRCPGRTSASHHCSRCEVPLAARSAYWQRTTARASGRSPSSACRSGVPPWSRWQYSSVSSETGRGPACAAAAASAMLTGMGSSSKERHQCSRALGARAPA